MQMICKVSNVFNDVRCPVCGQGFLVYWTRVAARNRSDGRDLLQDGLRRQHGGEASGAEAHAPAFALSDDSTFPFHQDDSLLATPGLLGMYN